MIPEDKAEIPREIVRQANVAISEATVLLLVVDARAGLTPLDAELARKLRTTGKPMFVAANKADTGAQGVLSAPFYELGFDVFPVSAEHGTGVDDLLDAVTKDFPQAAEAPESSTPNRLPAELPPPNGPRPVKFRWPSLAGPTWANQRC